MVIRKGEFKDIFEVVELFKELHEYHVQNEPKVFKSISKEFMGQYYLNTIQSDAGYFLVAEIDNKVVGFAEIMIVKTENHPLKHDNTLLRIEKLVIDNNYRRRKIASKLFEYIQNEAKKIKADYLDLGVHEFNKDAIKFYEAVGFKVNTMKMIKSLQ